jgi:glycogen phosphorylase
MSTRSHYAFPTDIAGFDQLVSLALDLRWSWNHFADQLWRQLDPELWSLTHNPWVVLLTASRTKIQELLTNPQYRQAVDEAVRIQQEYQQTTAWFQQAHPSSQLTGVAYFSLEFMLSEALPIYSGGLGNVAGDQLKAASDLGVPVIGVTLLYQQGYFRQLVDHDGEQHTLYPYNEPLQLPITPVRDQHGEWVRLAFALPGYTVWLRAWQAQVGRVTLYLLDSNDPANLPQHRSITSELYGGGPDIRLMQEMVLGIGGWRLLRTLGLQPEVCHLNEGHAAFAVLERAYGFMQDSGCTFPEALTVTRAGNLFTTHTAVAAGFDRFAPALIANYLGAYARQSLRISSDELLAMGRVNPKDTAEPFTMAYLALRGSGAVNGVSRLHAQVSRTIFQPLFPRWPQVDVPVGSVTNGVHMPTWDSAAADTLWTTACGKGRWRGTMDAVAADIQCVSDAALWQLRGAARQELIRYTRERLARQLAASGASSTEVMHAQHIFDPNTLTLGFARRFATYKRPNLLLHDPHRLARILTNATQPVQLLIAGKAHPDDHPGQAMIHDWVRFIRERPEVRQHAVFLSDYDMLLGEHLVQGVDVWINTPRRPWEACGTSGMKVLVNGGLNVSVLDGWWAEAYTPEVGWALGDGRDHGDNPSWDAADAEALYTCLEQEVIPSFYTRDTHGIPTTWVARMRASMAQLTPAFSANRSVREYTESYYLPAAAAYRSRAANHGALGSSLLQWQHHLTQHWAHVHFGTVAVETVSDQHHFRVQVYLNEIGPDAVVVELYADGVRGDRPIRERLTRGDSLIGAANGYVYVGAVSAERPVEEYTARVLPAHPAARIPLEASHILWQR